MNKIELIEFRTKELERSVPKNRATEDLRFLLSEIDKRDEALRKIDKMVAHAYVKNWNAEQLRILVYDLPEVVREALGESEK